MDSDSFEVHNFDRSCCFVKITHAYIYFLIKYSLLLQTSLIFSLSVTSDKNAVSVFRTLGNFVDGTCHE